jgi:hypothetical protein
MELYPAGSHWFYCCAEWAMDLDKPTLKEATQEVVAVHTHEGIVRAIRIDSTTFDEAADSVGSMSFESNEILFYRTAKEAAFEEAGFQLLQAKRFLAFARKLRAIAK